MNDLEEEIVLLESADALSHPFFQKQLVFTGGLTTMTRAEATKKARACGATFQGAVTQETDFVVIGNKKRGKSTKQLKAEQLVSLGYDVQMIEEADFLWILSIEWK